MCAVNRRVQTDLANPAFDNTSVLSGGNLWRAFKSAPEQTISCVQSSVFDSVFDRFAGISGDFELDRLTSLLLHHHRPARNFFAMSNVENPQFDQVASTKLAIDRQVKQRKIAKLVRHFKPGSYCPDFAKFERRFLSQQFAFIPGSAAVLVGLKGSLGV